MGAFKAYLKKYPQYKIVAIQDANWDQATSAKDTQQLLSKYASQGGIQGAYGMADNMAVGIIQGAKQAGVPIGVAKKGLIVSGSNCLAVGIKAIKAGLEYGTGTQAPQVEAALDVRAQRKELRAQRAPRAGERFERRAPQCPPEDLVGTKPISIAQKAIVDTIMTSWVRCACSQLASFV